ncbi:MAG TPA: Hpt domain-containing protein [Burkholderiaceae bacterium]
MATEKNGTENASAAVTDAFDPAWTVNQYLRAIRAAEPSVIALVLPAAHETMADLMSNLEQARTEWDRDRLVRAAHTMKSAGGYLGAVPVVRQSRSVEGFARLGFADELEQSLVLLRREVSQLLAAIDEISMDKDLGPKA